MAIWGGSARPDAGSSRLLGSAPLVAIGKVSYSWYLWHWPLLAFAHLWRLKEPSLVDDLICAAIALLLSAITLKYVENPVRHGAPFRTMSLPKLLTTGSVAMVLTMAVAGATYVAEGRLPPSPREAMAIEVANDVPDGAHRDCLIDKDSWDGVLRVEGCRFGAPGMPIKLVVWGDSHGMAWTPMIDVQAASLGFSYLQLTMSGCRPFAPKIIDRPNANCQRFRQMAVDEIARLQADGLESVVLAGRWPPMSGAVVPVFQSPPTHLGIRDLIRTENVHATASPLDGAQSDPLAAGASATFDLLHAMRLRVLVILDPPELKYPLPTCLYINHDEPQKCGIDRAYFDANFSPVKTSFRKAAASVTEVRVFDPASYFCDAEGCPPIERNGHPLLSDVDHISASSARAQAASLLADFEWLVKR
jgi:SGNH domain-containing protein